MPERAAFAGMIDRVTDRHISGWIVDKEHPDRQLDLVLVASDGRSLGHAKADRFHPALARFGLGAQHGFCFDLDAAFDHATARDARCRVAGRDVWLDLSRELADARPRRHAGRGIWPWLRRRLGLVRVLGHFDGVEMGVAKGWAYCPDEPEQSLRVQILCGSDVVAEALANTPRQDLLAGGFANGARAFQSLLPPHALACRTILSARVVGYGRVMRLSKGARFDRRQSFGAIEARSAETIEGWAVDLASTEPVVVEITQGGHVVACAAATIERPDLDLIGLPPHARGFKLRLPLTWLQDPDATVTARIKSTQVELDGSPLRADRRITKWLNRATRFPPATYDRLRARSKADVLISIIMPIGDARDAWVIQAIDGIVAQWSSRWDLTCIVDGSTAVQLIQSLRDRAARDPRIRVLRDDSATPAGPALGIASAVGRYSLVVDPHDVLEPDAVGTIVAATKRDPDLIYGDEAVTGEDITRIVGIACRPAFSLDYYRSCQYFAHALCLRTSIARAICGDAPAAARSGGVDFVLHAIERSRTVVHIPAILSRRREGPPRPADGPDAILPALQRHLDRTSPGAIVSAGPSATQVHIRYPDPGGRTAIIIPTKDRVDLLKCCIDSIVATCHRDDFAIYIVDNNSIESGTFAYFADLGATATVIPYDAPFNYSKLNNFAATHVADCRFLCFMNNDVEARQAGWLERLRSIAARADVGIVGPKLVYPDTLVQHAGVVIGLNGPADHAHKFQPSTLGGKANPGYLGGLTALRDYSAVTAACMVLEHETFAAAGGFDETFAVGFGDTDLCLRARGLGLKVLYDGATTLVHHESASRKTSIGLDHPEDSRRFAERWRDLPRTGDPFYNPLLSLEKSDHDLANRFVAGRFGVRVEGTPLHSSRA